MSDHSLVDWVVALREGNELAAAQLWDKVYPKLVRIARSKLSHTPKRVSDEEDIAISVFHRLCENVDRSAFKKIDNDDGLWKLLIRMTANRVVDMQRKLTAAKRGGGKVRGDSVFHNLNSTAKGGFDELNSEKMGPDFELLFEEEHHRLFKLLPDSVFTTIADMKMQGKSNAEIAKQCSLSERSIERKLAIIRDLWNEAESVD